MEKTKEKILNFLLGQWNSFMRGCSRLTIIQKKEKKIIIQSKLRLPMMHEKWWCMLRFLDKRKIYLKNKFSHFIKMQKFARFQVIIIFSLTEVSVLRQKER